MFYSATIPNTPSILAELQAVARQWGEENGYYGKVNAAGSAFCGADSSLGAFARMGEIAGQVSVDDDTRELTIAGRPFEASKVTAAHWVTGGCNFLGWEVSGIAITVSASGRRHGIPWDQDGVIKRILIENNAVVTEYQTECPEAQPWECGLTGSRVVEHGMTPDAK